VSDSSEVDPHPGHADGQDDSGSATSRATEFALERYRYLLQQIHTVNENVYRFLAIYQALATLLVSAILGLFTGYRQWSIEPTLVRTGIVGLLLLETFVALFACLLVVVGILAWLDYRSEECELTDEYAKQGFRSSPRLGNFFRWYETYIVIFIIGSTVCIWLLATLVLIPKVT